MMMVDSVEEGGFESLEAWDAEGAIRLLSARSDVRLVLTDIDMPGGMDGVELAALIRDRWPPIEVLITSAGPAPDTSIMPQRAVFMPKPLDRERLLDVLRKMSNSIPE